MQTTKKLHPIPFCGQTAQKFLTLVACLSILVTTTICPAYAADTTSKLQSSNIYTGFMAFLNEAMTVAMIASPIIAGLVAVVFLIRRSMADEQDGKMWNKRIITSIICGVAGSLVTGFIALLTSYF